VPDCPEGAFRIIDGKARLVSDLFCDGLDACIKSCPQNALSVTESETESYDERRVMANIVPQGVNVIKAHPEHLLSHGEDKLHNEACSYLDESGIKIQGIDS